MSPQKGRPLKAEQARDQRLEIRLTREEKECLENLSTTYGKSKTDILVSGMYLFAESMEGEK